MMVVLANHLPPAVRGRLKLWFVEPKPNVFVSGLRDHTAQTVVEYLFSYCSEDSGLLIFRKTRQSPGYRILTLGKPDKASLEYFGLQLIQEKKSGTESN